MHVTDGDSVPVAGRFATLHRVSIGEAGPVDSALTDAAGKYLLRATVLDTIANYVVSVEHDGIAYFTEPLHTFGAPTAEAEPLLVYDTSTTDPPIILRERHVVVRSVGEQNARRVIELLVLVNGGSKTRVVSDTTGAVWQGAIPHTAAEFQVGESDMSAEAVVRRDNAVVVTAPIPPGERQLLVSYLIPRSEREVRIPIDQPIERFNVMLEDTAAAVEGPLMMQGVEELDELTFRRYSANNIGEQSRIVVRFAAEGRSAAEFWWIIVPLAAIFLIGALVMYWRRAQPVPAIHGPLPADVLAAQIATLDAQYQERQNDPEYQKRREALKARLVEALRGD